MFTPILIRDKNTRELKINVKKLKFSRFLDFLCSDKKTWKSGRITIHLEPVHVG